MWQRLRRAMRSMFGWMISAAEDPEMSVELTSKVKAALQASREDIATTYATQLQTLRGAMLRNEQQLSAARQAYDKAMQVKQAFMREKDRKTNDAMQALRDARRAKWQSKVADAMESFQ